MPPVKVHVYESSDNEYQVEPKLVELNVTNGDTMKVKNHSNDDLFFYAVAGPFGTGPEGKPLKAKATITLTPVAQAQSGTMYAYQVINPKNGKKAKANSDPVMIVEN